MRLPIILLSILVSLIFSSCTNAPVDVNDMVAVGGKKYGGEFRFMSQEKINSLATVSSVYHYTSRVISQIYEPLLTVDMNSMKTIPAIAESYTVNDDATVYTFKIRKGVFFHQEKSLGKKGHELDAEDVKFSLEMACSGLEINKVGYLLINRIKGAEKFFNNSSSKLPKEGVEGIKIIDNNTVEITLANPFSGFENILTHSSLGIFPKEVYTEYGDKIGDHPVGTGPFKFVSKSDDKITLGRNNNYWQKDDFGNQLPYLGQVVITYAENKRSELVAFRKSDVDLVLEIPVEEVEHIFGSLVEAQEGKNIKHKIESESSMNILYVAMGLKTDEFKDLRVRKAFNIAINRDAIVDNALEGEGWASHNGFVPRMGNYPTENVIGFPFDISKAQSLMAQAGYPNGRGFPEIDFYSVSPEGTKTYKLCTEIVKQLSENLGVVLNIKHISPAERDEMIKKGEATLWAEGWLADYPDPENFLALFYGKNMSANQSVSNRYQFNDAEFNTLYEKAIAESDPEKRTNYLVKCDQIIINQAGIIPLYTHDNTVLVNGRVRDFKVNQMEMLNLTRVFIKEPKQN